MWFWAAALCVVVGLATCLVALVEAFGDELGDNVDVNCLSVPPPEGYPLEGPFRGIRSIWPFGTACEFGPQRGQGVLVPESDWTATVTGLLGVTITAGGALTAGGGIVIARREVGGERASTASTRS